MVIECTACHARFKLADDKVKPSGTKVRCSKCKEVFTVMPPAPAPPPAAEPPAAAGEEVDFGSFNMERVPEPPPETAAPSQQTPEPPSAGTEAPFSAQAPAPEPAFGEDQPTPETDFSFPEERSALPEDDAFGGEESDEFAFGEEPGDDTFGSGESDEFTFSTEQPEESASGEEQTQEEGEFAFGEEPGEDAFGSGESDEFAFGSEEESATADDFGFEESEAAGPVEFAFEEETSEEGGTEFSWESEEGGELDFDEGGESAGESEDFDFSGISFGEEEAAPAAPLVVPPPAAPQTARVEAEPFRPMREPAAAEAAGPAAAQPPVMPAARRRKSPLKGVMFFLLLLFLALLGGAVYLYWQGSVPELTRLVDRLTGQSAAPTTSGQIRLEGLSSFYVANREAGQMLVIEGQAVNGYPEPRSSITVKGVVFDKTGKAVLQQTVFCGNPFDQEALKKLPFAKIEEGMNNPFGESLSNLNIAPGKALPFTIVIRNLPADIAEFSVEVVDSKAGTKQ